MTSWDGGEDVIQSYILYDAIPLQSENAAKVRRRQILCSSNYKLYMIYYILYQWVPRQYFPSFDAEFL